MRPLKSVAICMVVCAFMLSLLAAPALAGRPWADDPPKNGNPEFSVSPTVGPNACQPMMLDENPWHDDPPKNGRPEFEASPTVGPYAWWLQPVLDDNPWADDPPRKNSPKQ